MISTRLKRWVRPFARTCIHWWQWIHDHSRQKLREYIDLRKITRRNTLIAEDDHGTRFVLYPFDRPKLLYLVHHPHDVAEFDAIPHLVRSGDTVFDIGANIGIYSVLLSRLCGPTGRVWSFEPVPDTYWRLRETLALNRCENVFPVQCAICEEPGSVKMNLFDSEFAEWNSRGTPLMLAPDGSEVSPRHAVEVRAENLDLFCDSERIERINFLKVDVEGFELSVFRGGDRLLKEKRIDHICFEISKEPLKSAGLTSREVFEALEIHGYGIYTFDRTGKRFHKALIDTVESWTNFFASCNDLSKLETGAPDKPTTEILESAPMLKGAE